ncbi:5-formyltetrahydrofolate cyclo-ligase [Simiduia curdlanivorans]|uniref:5-formyltetrahydrofolate cyclo-ligase n=1 Tax=Simiduia curdlanivorans TaxID=1492769 RepID=A0ABV8V3Z1_9GAMM|nr:5-formyltetrahydrofolate cyclo-ligase [Simiduia curdlanivorans]MDN3637439.1 5-formyltetrahydrofolate cyclo-ligase [Simiduia curdlanivorans]
MTINPATGTDQKKQLRLRLRQLRRSLTPAQQQRAAASLAQHLSQHLWFRQAKHIAFYLPNDGEIDPTPLLELALAQGKHCYLPVVMSGGKLQFRALEVGTRLTINKYNIIEPDLGARVRPVWLLNLILLPLVGFDLHGNRLGMGGGYYDRTLAAVKGRPTPSRRRVGLAHQCQRLASLDGDCWDIPLAAIATDKAFRLIGN